MTEYPSASPKFIFAVPYKLITEIADKHHADLIVMATRGHTGLDHLLIGSVTERVVRLATCPVLTMKVDALRAPTVTEAAKSES